MSASEVPNFTPAGQPEILRAYQRDQAQISQLSILIQDTFRALFGSRDLLIHEGILGALSSLIYYSLTFGIGTRTIGEEYTDILPFALTTRRLPSRTRRLLTLFLILLTPPLLLRLTKRLCIRYARLDRDLEVGRRTETETREDRVGRWIVNQLERGETWISLLGEVHLASFFFGGRFFEFGKRMMGIGYISTLPPLQDPSQRPTYSILGILLLLPLLKRLKHLLPLSSDCRSSSHDRSDHKIDSKFYLPGGQSILQENNSIGVSEDHDEDISENHAAEVEEENDEDKEARKCTLCLESWKAPCVVECGHVFCWDCLGEWRREKAECPLCRQPLNLSRLLPLYNI